RRVGGTDGGAQLVERGGTPEPGPGRRRGGLGALAPVVAQLALDEPPGPPPLGTLPGEVVERLAPALRGGAFSVPGSLSESLLDRPLDPTHVIHASAGTVPGRGD